LPNLLSRGGGPGTSGSAHPRECRAARRELPQGHVRGRPDLRNRPVRCAEGSRGPTAEDTAPAPSHGGAEGSLRPPESGGEGRARPALGGVECMARRGPTGGLVRVRARQDLPRRAWAHHPWGVRKGAPVAGFEVWTGALSGAAGLRSLLGPESARLGQSPWESLSVAHRGEESTRLGQSPWESLSVAHRGEEASKGGEQHSATAEPQSLPLAEWVARARAHRSTRLGTSRPGPPDREARQGEQLGRTVRRLPGRGVANAGRLRPGGNGRNVGSAPRGASSGAD
jgi:hypothetical protein